MFGLLPKNLLKSGATWEITGDGALADAYGSGITNSGTVLKSARSGTNSLSGAFYNHGLVDVASGAIQLATSAAPCPAACSRSPLEGKTRLHNMDCSC